MMASHGSEAILTREFAVPRSETGPVVQPDELPRRTEEVVVPGYDQQPALFELDPREQTPLTSAPEQSLESRILDAAIHQIGSEVVYANHLIGNDTEKREALVDGYEKAAEKLSMDVVDTEEGKSAFHQKALEALEEMSIAEVNDRLAKDLIAANQQIAQEARARHEIREDLYSLERELRDRKISLIMAQRDMTGEEQRGPKGAALQSEIMFIDKLLQRREKPLAPPTRILPSTDELEAQMQLESPEDASPARGINIKGLAARAIDVAKR